MDLLTLQTKGGGGFNIDTYFWYENDKAQTRAPACLPFFCDFMFNADQLI